MKLFTQILVFFVVLNSSSFANGAPKGFNILIRPLRYNSKNSSIDCVILFENKSKDLVCIRGVSLLDQYTNEVTRSFSPRMVVSAKNSSGEVKETTIFLCFSVSLIPKQTFAYCAKIYIPKDEDPNELFISYKFSEAENKIDTLLSKRATLGPTEHTVNAEIGRPKDIYFNDDSLGKNIKLTFSDNGYMRYKYVDDGGGCGNECPTENHDNDN